jgi:hypothetical protein
LLRLFVAPQEGVIKIWSADNALLLDQQKAHPSEVTALIMHSRFVWSADGNGNLFIWKCKVHLLL